ncbi:probable G-protein coupled receptor 148 [Pygocentrus nattereri]|uniref:probable G-protein coupled receptor 148 n=1 Tax=Pygocentrus nattereri TaxID=42514 RepID=UPI0008148D68|nr:probable G-protein coupled receptor 148 [Pygocentrus nattereri]
MNYSSLALTSMEWHNMMQSKRLDFFLIPATVFTTVTLLIDPLLLFCILRNQSFRQETRYLLLANTLLSDALFLVFNLANLSSNAANLEMHFTVCEVITVTTMTTYCSSVLTVTLMVIDTFLAVRWPLRYNQILPPSRAIKLIGFVWAVAALYPLILLVVMEVSEKGIPQRLKVCVVLITLGSLGNNVKVPLYIYINSWVIVCMVLIFYCYIRLYTITKSSGIWSSRYSRARLTLLAHALMLLMYFVPGLIYTAQLGLFDKNVTFKVWLNTVNLSVLMLLPRACAPYLYGLRYRKLYDTVQVLLRRRCLSSVTQSQQAQAS